MISWMIASMAARRVIGDNSVRLKLRPIIVIVLIITISTSFFFYFKSNIWAKKTPTVLNRSGKYTKQEFHYTVDGRNDVRHPRKNISRIVIIGAGPTALGAAKRLYDMRHEHEHIQVMILEQSDQVGGLSTSKRDENGFLWDMGAHIVFSHYKYFDETVGDAVLAWNRQVGAAYALMKDSDGERRLIPYPIQNNVIALDKIGREKVLKDLTKIVNRGKMKLKPVHFDQWLVENFGPSLCDMFLRRYNKKFWTLGTMDINTAWVDERVPLPDINILKAQIKRLAEETKGENVGPDFVRQPSMFWYPQFNGTGNIWRSVAERLPKKWFKFNVNVTNVNLDLKTIQVENIEDKDSNNKKVNKIVEFDALISTMPLDKFTQTLKSQDESLQLIHSLSSELIYTKTHIIGLGLKGQPPEILANKSWVYIPDDDAPFYRVTLYSSYSDDHVPDPTEYWSLLCEAAEPQEHRHEKYWSKSNLVRLTINSLVEYGFIKESAIVSKFYRRLNHGYPVPSSKRDVLLNAIQPWLESYDVYSRGRFGGWKYEVSNQDHAFMQGVEVVDRLLKGVPEETYKNPRLVNSKKNTGRSRRLKREVVVAQYDEDINWMKQFADIASVYHKGSDQTSPFYVNRWKKLPNIGREAHTYLYHIIKNYDNLADVTVFVQGHLTTGPEKKFCYESIPEFFKQATIGNFCKTDGRIANWDRIDHVSKWKHDFLSGKMRVSSTTLGRFYATLFGHSPPESVPRCLAGCFSATKYNLRRFPVKFYKRAIEFVSDHSNPEEAHYLERLWCSIINCRTRSDELQNCTSRLDRSFILIFLLSSSAFFLVFYRQ